MNLQKIGLILLGLSLTGLIFVFKHEAKRFRDASQLQAVELSTLKGTVKVLEKKNGELAFQIESVGVDKRNLKESLELSSVEIKVLRQQGIKYQNLIGLLELKIASFGSGQTTVIDTFRIVEEKLVYYQKVNDWTDGYLRLYNGQIERGVFGFDYTYGVALRLFPERRKNAIVVTANLSNPNASIVSGHSISVSTKLKWFERPWVWGAAGLGTGLLISR